MTEVVIVSQGQLARNIEVQSGQRKERPVRSLPRDPCFHECRVCTGKMRQISRASGAT